MELGQRKNRKQKAYADNTHIPQFPQPERRLGLEVIGVDIQMITSKKLGATSRQPQ